MDMSDAPSEILFSFSKHQTLGLFPLTESYWRMDGIIPELSLKKEKIDFEDVQNYLNSDRNLNFRILESGWFSVFRSHSRYAPAMKHHHCFLAGDAAHVHSPVGAQGMNTGLQDAYNLGWKLAFFLKGYARASILDTYQEERLPVARNVIGHTDRIYRWITANQPVPKYLRLYFFPVLLRALAFLMKRSSWCWSPAAVIQRSFPLCRRKVKP
jgi:2-polyprenyl-6-methoxyphenol hydroxylase-like FAD-dependent oxidoreductase